jgi:hypothetical protein
MFLFFQEHPSSNAVQPANGLEHDRRSLQPMKEFVVVLALPFGVTPGAPKQILTAVPGCEDNL